MGCGHSKINIYPKRNRNKNVSAKKTVTPEKAENVEEETENVTVDAGEENSEDVDKKTIKVKPYGGPLIAHPELSASQNNFFKMLDEKIESGPDYDSSSENEKALEKERVTTLLRDWETASAGSRSLPATPKRRPGGGGGKPPPPQNATPFNASMVHQSYGVTPYRQAYATPVYAPAGFHHPQAPSAAAAAYSSALQYQALSSLYGRQYSQQAALLGSSPVKSYTSPAPPAAAVTASPKHIPSYPGPPSDAVAGGGGGAVFSPKMYKSARLSNGDLIQQQIYQQQLQYQQAREYQQYKQSREQQLIQHQQGIQAMQASAFAANPNGRSYQSSIHIPIVQNDITQYDLT